MTTQPYVHSTNGVQPRNRMSTLRPDSPELDRQSASSRTHDNPDQNNELLQLLVQMTLRLRLRGVDLESSTGLSGRELDLVASLGSSGPTSVKELVGELGLARSTMTAIVDRLEARGLIKRLPNPQDRRSVILASTPRASEALLRYREGMQSFVRHLNGILGRDEQIQLTRLIQKIHGSF